MAANGGGAWKKLKDKVKAKRTKNDLDLQKRPKGEEIIVQRLSAQVSGKAQKYSRMGPREFVPFLQDVEFNLANIKAACVKHFMTGKHLSCDVLAAEQGPSCKSVSQIPDTKVIFVRFIQTNGDEQDDTDFSTPEPRSAKRAKPASEPSVASQSAIQIPTAVPKSLSISAMLNLGKVVRNSTERTLITIFKFNLATMVWELLPEKVQFDIASTHFGEGGFRRAFKASSPSLGYRRKEWVIKKYLETAKQCIADTMQSCEEHTKKVVQTHLLAKNLAEQLHNLVEDKGVTTFGRCLEYNEVYMGKIEATDEFVTIEEFIPGEFKKFVNNDGAIKKDIDELCLKAQCFSHFSYYKTEQKLMVLDIQGSGYIMFDPEIASVDLLSADSEYMFCTGNLSAMAINSFIEKHECNKYCKLLDLDSLK